MHGFFGRIAMVDLGAQRTRIEALPDALCAGLLGGKGLATHLLLRDNPAGADPLGPDNRLIFATGPLTGSGVWGSCRHGVFTRSPQTGFYSESYSGGSAALAISATGFDALVIHGRAARPIWLEVSESGVRFHPADDLWGLDTFLSEDAVTERVKAAHPESRRCGVVVIGPAGEHRVAFAVIENDYWRSAGRTGVGAVMGAKRLKAIAFHGAARRPLADEALLKQFSRQLAQAAKDDPGVMAYKNKGTPMMVDVLNKVGAFPTRYWQKGRYEHAEKINAAALHAACDVKPNACRHCFIACGRLATVKSGRHAGLTLEGPEYETIYAFGGLCEIDRIEEIVYLNDLCDRLGMDTISAGNLAALTIEAVRQGKTRLAIDYGDVDGIAALLGQIARREALGAVLADGINAAARHFGMQEQAIHVKGLEPAGYDPRVLKGMGLAYGTSDRGACHLRATFYKPELAGMVDPETIAGKAAVFTEWEDRLTIFDTLVLCRFYRDLYPWEKFAVMIKGATGLELDREGLRRIAGRISDLTRRFNLREGLTRADDRLPSRFAREALPETGKTIAVEQMEQLLTEYYRARGWDADGRPPEPTAC
jgi:aldehyde:ferredoxin oxidoreductase